MSALRSVLVLAIAITLASAACTAPGQRKWMYNTTATNVGDPSYAEGRVFVAADQVFYAFDAETGNVDWKVTYPSNQRPREKMPGLSRHGGGGDGVVFVVIEGGQFVALNQKTGATAWSFQTDSQGWCANPQPDDANDLVFSYTETTLYGVTTSTGALKWSLPLNNTAFGTECTVTVDRDERMAKSYVYVSTSNSQNKYDAATGKLLWSFPMTEEQDAHGTASVAVCERDHTRYATFLVEGGYSNSLIALHAETGQFVWNYTCADSNSTNYDNIANHNPAALGRIFVKCIYSLMAVHCHSGEEDWSFLAPASDGGLSSPSVHTYRDHPGQGTLYIGSDDMNLLALDANTGKLLWRGKTDGDLWSDPIRAGDAVFVGSQDGGFYAFCA